MLKKMNILFQLQKNYIFAVVRGKTKEDGFKISQYSIRGGIKNIEVTFSTPGASDVINELVAKYSDDKSIVIGAGTVMDASMASIAIQAGAKFIVSPHFDNKISEICNLNGIPYLPGCATVTEIITAFKTGVDVVKLFPGGTLGTSFIKDVHGPLPHVEMMPSGGVSIDNMEEWYKAGAWSVGVGSALTKNISSEGYEYVEFVSSQFVSKLENIKK